ncbi:hypothetical protein LR48_Vigan05g165600 [Vigna angularis]|uniref:Uncharacterized protein n=1 Tax=Phaseolus angularis TaxID=3914 RepID=A0A0L9UMY3_PHAAN|nr:hypothetical protein LR48_Vigan05g165600 [Vigna angularis]
MDAGWLRRNGVLKMYSNANITCVIMMGLRPRGKIDNMLFVPTVGDDHWWCYAVNCQSREMFILDSLGHKRRRRKSIDKAMVAILQELFNMIDIDSNCKEQELKVIEEDLPVQPPTNNYKFYENKWFVNGYYTKIMFIVQGYCRNVGWDPLGID